MFLACSIDATERNTANDDERRAKSMQAQASHILCIFAVVSHRLEFERVR